ncbi:MAG: hypothetical protein GX275_03290 [Clostridiales bacterium]|nr:hypothetical protein [Clostridiales bacterium]
MKKKLKLNLLIVSGVIALFFLLHSTPTLAVRSKLFFDGHMLGAFQGKVEFNEFQHNLDKEVLESLNSKIYCITEAKINDFETGNGINNFRVNSKGFLYFAYYYGEA